MVGVHRLAAQVVGPPGPAGAVQMAVLRVSVAHTLSGVAAILFELFGSFGTVFSGPPGRFLQPLLPVGVQTVSIIPWALLELHQLLRGTGGIGLHIKSVPKPTGHRAVWDTLAYYFLKQPPEALAEGGLPPPQLGDGTVVRHPVQEVQPKYVRIGDFVSGFIVARSARGFGGTPTSIFAVQKRQVSIHLPCLILTCTPQTCGNAKNRIIFLSLMYSRILLQ